MIAQRVVAVTVAAAFALGACGGSDDANSNETNGTGAIGAISTPAGGDLLAVQHGDGATLAADGDAWKLVIARPAPDTVLFADSPATDVAVQPSEELVTFINERPSAPNATIDWGEGDAMRTLAATLSDAAVDPESGAFSARVVPLADDGQPAFFDAAGNAQTLDADSLVEASVSIYVDGSGTGGCRALIVNSLGHDLTLQEDDKKSGAWSDHPPETIPETVIGDGIDALGDSDSPEYTVIRVRTRHGSCGWSAAYTDTDGNRVKFMIKSTFGGHGDKSCHVTDNPDDDVVCTTHPDTDSTDVFFHVGYKSQNIH